jgi:hypothetical protein
LRNRTLKLSALLLPALIALIAVALPAVASAATTGTIEGQVSAEGFVTGGVEVCAESFEDFVEHHYLCTEATTSGFYAITNLPPDEYIVSFDPEQQNLVAQYWPNQVEYFSAGAVKVTAGNVTQPISANLVKGATLSGTITAAATGARVAGVEACAEYQDEIAFNRCAVSDSAGHYTIPGLFQGKWQVIFNPYRSGQNFVFQEDPTPISVSTQTPVNGVNIALIAGAQLGGTVRLAATGAPLAGVRVCVSLAAKVDTYECLKTSASGAYLFDRLPTGSYKVAFSPETSELLQQNPRADEAAEFAEAPDAYPTQWWNAKPSFATAQAIPLVQPQIVTGIDGSLGPPAAGPPPPAPIVAKPVKKPVLICHKGFAKKKVRGKPRCVKLHKPHHHRKHAHKPDQAKQRPA